MPRERISASCARTVRWPAVAERAILHVDLDAFFASVEQRDDPTLRGRPVVVGGTGGRGVVAAASYEARAFGIRSAMPVATARRACPRAVFLPPRPARYREVSREVMAVVGSFSPVVEQVSIDEAFIDVTGARRLVGEPGEVATRLRTAIRGTTGLAASVGIATTKFLAKVASDLAKPDGVLAVGGSDAEAFLAPLPVVRCWGVGPATLARLDRLGVRTIGDLTRVGTEVLTPALGAGLAAHLVALARNDDPRPVVPGGPAKSIGAEETFATDLRTRADCDRELLRLADRVGARLRSAGASARTVTVKVRFGDFETRTRARTLGEPTAVTAVILDAARGLLETFDPGRGVRLLGITASNLVSGAGPVQTELFVDEESQRREATERRGVLDRAVDEVRARFGRGAVQPAVLLDRDRGTAT